MFMQRLEKAKTHVNKKALLIGRPSSRRFSSLTPWWFFFFSLHARVFFISTTLIVGMWRRRAVLLLVFSSADVQPQSLVPDSFNLLLRTDGSSLIDPLSVRNSMHFYQLYYYQFCYYVLLSYIRK